MKGKNRIIVSTALLATAALAVVLWCYSPLSLPCVFKYITGYDCPGCGTQRALRAYASGDFVAAINYNPLLPFAIAAGVFYVVVEAAKDHWPRLYRQATRPAILWAMLGIIVIFWIVRNL